MIMKYFDQFNGGTRNSDETSEIPKNNGLMKKKKKGTLFDFSPLLPPNNNLPHHNDDSSRPLPLLYSIKKGMEIKRNFYLKLN